MPAKSKYRPSLELNELSQRMWDGRKLLDSNRTTEACDAWLEAWELVEKLATPEMRTVRAFDDAYYHDLPERVFNWCQDLEQELGNGGLVAMIRAGAGAAKSTSTAIFEQTRNVRRIAE